MVLSLSEYTVLYTIINDNSASPLQCNERYVMTNFLSVVASVMFVTAIASTPSEAGNLSPQIGPIGQVTNPMDGAIKVKATKARPGLIDEGTRRKRSRRSLGYYGMPCSTQCYVKHPRRGDWFRRTVCEAQCKKGVPEPVWMAK